MESKIRRYLTVVITYKVCETLPIIFHHRHRRTHSLFHIKIHTLYKYEDIHVHITDCLCKFACIYMQPLLGIRA